MNQQQKQYDIVIFGATGFTGQLLAEYCQQQYANSGLKWAIAGRNQNKLAAIKQQYNIDDSVDSLIADSNDIASLRHIAQQTAVIISTVGPYQLYGEKLLQACVESGIGYVDLCGEPTWMHNMINKYQSLAENSGAKIIFSCGFDSVPFDLGVYLLQKQQIDKGLAPFKHVKGRVRKMQGKFSGGTAASLKATLNAAFTDPKVMQILTDPYALASNSPRVEQPAGDQIYFDEQLNSWTSPFIMAAINTRNVLRSNMLLGHAYGEDFTYDEMLLTGAGEQGEALAKMVANDKSLSGDDAPKPGEGPTKEERDNGFYDIIFVAQDDKQHSHILSVSAELDPGYGSTSKMLTESALTLLQEFNNIAGGIYTPASALGSHLIERLEKFAGLRFTKEQ